MPSLKQQLQALTMTAFEKPTSNPQMDRRNNVIRRLEEQKKLFADPSYKRTVRTKNGDKQHRVSPSWYTMPDGKCVFVVKAGFKPIEFAKGKSAIVVPSLDKLPAIIDTLIAATREGEFDSQLEQASATIRSKLKRKKAA
jgi:hypothetical protein